MTGALGLLSIKSITYLTFTVFLIAAAGYLLGRVTIKGINLGTAQVINYAHSHNVAIHYWTVNDADRMAYLTSIRADGIMSDYPDLLSETLRR